MRRGSKIALGLAVVLALVLTLNTITVNNETKEAEVRVDGGKILQLAGGDLQVLDTGPPPARRPGPPIVVIHCFTCAIDWWDDLVGILSPTRRVVAIDLLGHGGSDKPSSGYEIEEQAGLVTQAMARLEIEGATVVGHSLGAAVAVALASQSRELVDRLVLIGEAPDNSFGELGFLAKTAFMPVLGQALHRITPDFVVRDGLGEAFAPGFDVPDRFVDDFREMTYTAFDQSASASEDYEEESPLDERVKSALVPLMVIFGAEDQIYDAEAALEAYDDIPGARTELITDVGHSPNVEAPERTAELINDFSPSLAVPEPEPGPEPGQGGETLQRASVTCADAVGRAAAPAPAQRTATGPFFLAGPGRDFATAQVVDGVLQVKVAAFVEGKRTVVVRVGREDRGRVGLIYEDSGPIRTPADAADEVTFKPCAKRKLTGWPGALAISGREPITLLVTVGGGRAQRLEVG